ncbi:hypothetical protein BGZ98_005190, partial [Dissophora globulifera]
MVKLIPGLILSLSAIASIVIVAADPGDCTLTVPKNPLTAQGLATPYILQKGNCDQTAGDQQVFVEATVFDPATGAFSVYHPLVINQGTQAAIKPIVPVLPANAVVGLWFGANSNSVTLQGDIAACVNGLSNQDIFGQVAFCNAAAFFTAVKASRKPVIPAIGKDTNGNACPTTRFFGIIDQDQSDNVITTYLQTKAGTFAQNTAANAAKLKGATVIMNGSDNALVADFLDPQLGCTPMKAPSLMEKGVMLGSMALNELQAGLQTSPVAQVPATDPMVLSNNNPSLTKLNNYRKNVGQTVVQSLNQASSTAYCTNLDKIQPPYLKNVQAKIVKGASPMPDVANNLFTFMGQRYAASWVNLGCDQLLKKTSAITVTMNGNIATAVQF